MLRLVDAKMPGNGQPTETYARDSMKLSHFFNGEGSASRSSTCPKAAAFRGFSAALNRLDDTAEAAVADSSGLPQAITSGLIPESLRVLRLVQADGAATGKGDARKRSPALLVDR
jgi:hypothetical protein